jgi:hypothetical protein
MNPQAQLLIELQNQITTQVPEIRYVDLNLGQYLNDEFRKQMLFPCVLIDFASTDFSELQGLNQIGVMSIGITLFYDIWNNTNSLTPLDVKEAGLTFLETKINGGLRIFVPNFVGSPRPIVY